ncbi:MAG: RCC1 domain-containing protein [Pseudobacter sp.]|uniref:RCC1 domain-containing protein n=1 Tax=Pseudobacter sp. TaxID=2045420 RepID=UPI003F7DBFFC
MTFYAFAMNTSRSWLRKALILILLFTTLQQMQAQCPYYTKIASSGVGGMFTIALKSDGTLWAWGYNNNGQLGDNTTTTRHSPVQILPGTTWKEIAVGSDFSLAIRSDGTLWTWGSNNSGQLGNNTLTRSLQPIQIGTSTLWSKITGGSNFSAGVMTDGTAWGWGYNVEGATGTGSAGSVRVPTRIGTATDWKTVSAGTEHCLGLKTDGSVWAWGSNYRYALGDNSNVNRNTPVKVHVLTGQFTMISAGYSFSMALKDDGTAWFWGTNGEAQHGNNLVGDRPQPVQMTSVTDWVYISATDRSGMGIRTNGTLWAWGDNGYGSLGTGNQWSQQSPVQIGTNTNWTAVYHGRYFTFGLLNDLSVRAWGTNNYGQLGNNSTTNVYAPFIPFASPATALALTNQEVTQTQSVSGPTDYQTSCTNLIMTITRNGSIPLTGNVQAKVYFDNAPATRHVIRHYEIRPISNNYSSTARVKFYFTQNDFDAYNLLNRAKLPLNPADAENYKSNIRIECLNSASSDNSGSLTSYTNSQTTYDPVDSDITWNAASVRWEITVDVDRMGGYFLKTETHSLRQFYTADLAGLGGAFPPAVAYSLRKLSSTYNNYAITIRRADDQTMDISFLPSGMLDTNAIKNFIPSGDGYVTKWFDQSGYARHLTQPNKTLQPRIISNGVIDRFKTSPALYFGMSGMSTAKEVIFTNGTSMIGTAYGLSGVPAAFVTKTGTASGSNQAHPGPFDFTNNGAEFTVGDAASTVYNLIRTSSTNPVAPVNNQAGPSVFSFTIPATTGQPYRYYYNGYELASNNVVAYSDGGNPLMVGNRNDGSSSGNFLTPELLLFNEYLGDTERKSGQNNLMAHYLVVPLPVTWNLVRGNLNNNRQAVLNWQVTEYNVAKYEIEKSVDATNYKVVGTINSVGDGQHSYNFTEAVALSGSAFYRIRQYDLDGRATYSVVIRLSNKPVKSLEVLYSGNNNMVIQLGPELLNTPLFLLDMNGRKLQQLSANSSAISLDLSAYPPGIYILKTATGIVEKIKR